MYVCRCIGVYVCISKYTSDMQGCMCTEPIHYMNEFYTAHNHKIRVHARCTLHVPVSVFCTKQCVYLFVSILQNIDIHVLDVICMDGNEVTCLPSNLSRAFFTAPTQPLQLIATWSSTVWHKIHGSNTVLRPRRDLHILFGWIHSERWCSSDQK
jgi:hypothetical protein